MGVENPPAFGMTLRDWFAGQALAGFLSDGSQRLVAEAFAEDGLFAQEEPGFKAHVVYSQLASGSYMVADAMLAERSKP